MSNISEFVPNLPSIKEEVDCSNRPRRSIQPTASTLSLAQTPLASSRLQALKFDGQCLKLGDFSINILKVGFEFKVDFSGVNIDSKLKKIVRDVIEDFNSLLDSVNKYSSYCFKLSNTVLNLGEDYKRLNELVSVLVREKCGLRPMYESLEQKCELEQSSLNVISTEDEQLTLLQAAIIGVVEQFRCNPAKQFFQFKRSNTFFCNCVGKLIGVKIEINPNFGVIFVRINRVDSSVLNQQHHFFKVDRREGPIDIFFTRFKEDISRKLPIFYTCFSCYSMDQSNQIDVWIERNVNKDSAYLFSTSLVKCSNLDEDYMDFLISFFGDELKRQLKQFNPEDPFHLNVLKQNLNSYIHSLTE